MKKLIAQFLGAVFVGGFIVMSFSCDTSFNARSEHGVGWSVEAKASSQANIQKE